VDFRKDTTHHPFCRRKGRACRRSLRIRSPSSRPGTGGRSRSRTLWSQAVEMWGTLHAGLAHAVERTVTSLHGTASVLKCGDSRGQRRHLSPQNDDGSIARCWPRRSSCHLAAGLVWSKQGDPMGQRIGQQCWRAVQTRGATTRRLDSDQQIDRPATKKAGHRPSPRISTTSGPYQQMAIGFERRGLLVV
jgi:hypothetical protein